MIEQRSVVLAAIILALVLAGGVFFFAVDRSQLGTGAPVPADEAAQAVTSPEEPTTPAEVPDTATAISSPVAETGEQPAVAGAQDDTSTPSPTPALQDVAATAETGSGSLLLLAALIAIGLGLIGAAAIAFGSF